MTSGALIDDDGMVVLSPDPATEQVPAVDAGSSDGRVTTMFRRYEVVAAAVAVIVVIVRLAGGGFLHERSTGASEEATPAVAPFTGPGATAPGAAAPGEAVPATIPPALQAALPGPVTPAVRSLLAPVIASASAAAPASATAASTPPATFDDGGKLGDVAPVAKVPSPGAPAAVVVGTAGDAWVATDNGGGQGADGAATLFHFDAAGALQKSVPLGDLHGITAMAAGPGGSLLVATRTPATVSSVDPATGAAHSLSTIPNVTPCVPAVVTTACDGSVVDQPPVPSALALDGRGAIYVGDDGQGAIWKVPLAGGDAHQFTVQSTWANPTRPAGPSGLAVDGTGRLVVVVRSLLTEDVGVVYLQAVGADGTAGTLTELARTDQGARPAGVALGVSGKVYVTLSALGRVLVLGPDGHELARTPASAAPAIDTPTGIAFRGHSLLVTALTPSRADGATVVRLPVGETGAPRFMS